jgi:hypothetical protein
MGETYYKTWYQANRERIADRRRKAYRDDAEYRERVLERSRLNRKARQRTGRRVRCFDVDGRRVCLVTARAFAEMVGRGYQTINLWQRKGRLPRTPFVARSGIRYYVPAMAEVVRRVLAEGTMSHEDFHALVLDGWRSAGIPVDCDSVDEALKVFSTDFHPNQPAAVDTP